MRRQVCVLHRVDLHCVHRQLHPCSLWLAAKYGTGMSHFPFLIPTFLVKDALALQGVHLLFFFFFLLLNDGSVFVWSDFKEKSITMLSVLALSLCVFFFFLRCVQSVFILAEAAAVDSWP